MCLFYIGYQLDLFKRPLSLTVMSKEKTFTWFGVVLSVMVVTVICLSFFQSDMVQKTSPFILEKTTLATIAPNQTFGKSLPFMFGLVDVNENGYIDDTMFKIDVAIFGPDSEVGPAGYREIIPVPCETISNSLFLNQKPTFTNYSCILDDNIVIQGQRLANDYQAIFFQLRMCNNETDNITCKSEDEIANFLAGMSLYTIYPDYTYDIDNYDTPYSAKFTILTQPLSLNNSIWLGEAIKQSTFINDEFFLYSDPIKTILSLSDISTTSTFPILSGQLAAFNTIYNPLTVIYFSSSNNVHYISRTYQKIQTALANCSGIASALLIIGTILTEFHSRITLLIIVIKNLYVFKTNKSKNKELKEKKFNLAKNDYQETRKALTKKSDQKKEYELRSPIIIEELILKKTSQNIMISKTDTIKENDNNLNKKNTPMVTIQNFEEPTNIEEKHEKKVFLREYFGETKIKQKILSDSEIPPPPEIDSIPDDQEIKIKAEDSIRMMSYSITKGQESKIKVDNDKINEFEEYLKQHEQHNKNFNINITNFMIAKGKKFVGRKLTQKEKLLLKAEEVFDKEIDIVSILLKLQEIEKLKFVLLNPSQISLLKLLDKPVISCDEDNQNLMVQLSRTILESGLISSRFRRKNTLVENYKHMIRSENKSEIDCRILQLLDDEMKLRLSNDDNPKAKNIKI